MKKTILLFAIIFSLFSCSKDDETTSSSSSTTPIAKDIYTCGYEGNGSKLVAKVWKNRIATILTDGTQVAKLYGIDITTN